ncbi:MAG: rRNA maturation RNase YbeY [Parvularculaceae bacterium]|nr:rRNA maturation RNase YbeY [Parvularculaceae bacterium]
MIAGAAGFSVEIVVDDPEWSDALPDAAALVARAAAAARRIEPRLDGTAALLLADDETLRDLNQRFRGLDKTTNVLSFPSGEADHLGDVAIALGVARREASERAADLGGYVSHLLVHGLLHLIGYDHIEDREAEAMESVESAVLDALGVYNPYAAEESI